MNTAYDIIQKGKEVIQIEADAIAALEDRIDENFEKAVELLLTCKGRVIVTGMGKSGIIGRKIASTLTSTGTAAFFLHPAEGVHGDLGAVMKDDVVIAISKSGNTEEILRLLPLFKRQDVRMIVMTAGKDSLLSKKSDVTLDVSVPKEACDFDIVPTTSTTATLVMGDAIALALFHRRGLSIEDFARFHPAGDIGRRLLLLVEDLMKSDEDMPAVTENTPLTEAILEITSKRLGATCVLNEKQELSGIITDGDLRRLIEKHREINGMTAKEAMTCNPKVIHIGSLAAKAMHVMEQYSITQLVILDEQNKAVGMVHLHDLIKAGLA